MAQIKVYAGDETSRKWDVICSRFTSKTAAFAAMVEQYHGILRSESDCIMAIIAEAETIGRDGISPTKETCRQFARELEKRWPGCITYNEATGYVVYRGPRSNLEEAGMLPRLDPD